MVGPAPGEQLDHVLQVGQPVVDRSGRQHVELLPVTNIEEPPIAREDLPLFALQAGVPEVVRLVDDDNVGHFL